MPYTKLFKSITSVCTIVINYPCHGDEWEGNAFGSVCLFVCPDAYSLWPHMPKWVTCRRISLRGTSHNYTALTYFWKLSFHQETMAEATAFIWTSRPTQGSAILSWIGGVGGPATNRWCLGLCYQVASWGLTPSGPERRVTHWFSRDNYIVTSHAVGLNIAWNSSNEKNNGSCYPLQTLWVNCTSPHAKAPAIHFELHIGYNPVFLELSYVA